jgi:hypothetical protein
MNYCIIVNLLKGVLYVIRTDMKGRLLDTRPDAGQGRPAELEFLNNLWGLGTE